MLEKFYTLGVRDGAIGIRVVGKFVEVTTKSSWLTQSDILERLRKLSEIEKLIPSEYVVLKNW